MMNKNSFYAAVVTVLFAGILAKMKEMLDKQAPLGYEDSEGFHYGIEPMDQSKD